MQTFENFAIKYQKDLLTNGSEVRLLSRKGFPIHVQACIRAGTSLNNVPGLAHFVEHMLVSGTKSFPTKLEINEALNDVGGSLEATTDRDLLRITLSLPDKKSLDLGFSILNEILTAPTLNNEFFEIERSVISRELNDRKGNSALVIFDKLMNELYPDYELKGFNLGTQESISKITHDDIVNFIQSNIIAERMTFIVSGDVEMSDIKNELEKIKIPNGRLLIPAEIPFKTKSERILTIDRHSDSTEILFGYRCDTKFIDEIVSLLLMQQLCQGRSSLFMQELRYAKGLVYGGSTSIWDYNGTSVFGIRTMCASDQIVNVLEIITKIITNITQNGITEKQLLALKIKFQSQFIFSHQSSREWLDAETTAVRHTFIDENENNALTILSHVENISLSSLNRLIGDYFNLLNVHLIIHGTTPTQSLTKLKQILHTT
jgi:zinc protease